MFEYSICNQPNEILFKKQCRALEQHISGLKKEKDLVDVDGSKTTIYSLNNKKLNVHNSIYVGALYIESEFDIEPFFTT